MAIRAAPPVESTIRREQRLRMTYEQFLTWADGNVHAEWVDGEVIVFMPPKPLHQRIATFLLSLLDLYTQFFHLGEVLPAPTEMKVTPTGSSREPDIFYVAREHAGRFTETKLAGPADLIVEIVSDDSVSRDREDKFKEYERAGVSEYWIIDNRPDQLRADFYQPGEDGRFRAVPPDEDGKYHSDVIPGFWLKVDWLWQDPLPDPQLTFAEIVGYPAEVVAAIEDFRRKARMRET